MNLNDDSNKKDKDAVLTVVTGMLITGMIFISLSVIILFLITFEVKGIVSLVIAMLIVWFLIRKKFHT